MELDRPHPSDATDLCTSCGLCCSGALYDSVPIKADDTSNAAALGLKPYDEPPGQPRFDLPCRHLEGTRCGVYGRRPSTCAEFRCELLKRFDRGQITKSDAKACVDEAKATLDQIISMMPAGEGPITPKRWGLLLEEWRTNARLGHKQPVEGALILELAKLNRFFDLNFRSADQQVVLSRE